MEIFKHRNTLVCVRQIKLFSVKNNSLREKLAKYTFSNFYWKPEESSEHESSPVREKALVKEDCKGLKAIKDKCREV